jgi:hypothetical protein
MASDGQVDDYFGWSGSISNDGNTCFIGAYGEDEKDYNTGSAYVFTRDGSTWTQEVKIMSSDGLAGDYFGRSCSISGDGNTCIVGAYSEDTNGSYAGAAYIFEVEEV